MKYRLLGFLFFIFLLYACKPYDSDEVNRQLLQGKWMLLKPDYADRDSVASGIGQEYTYLSFDADTCREDMPDLHIRSTYIFKVNDFTLNLYARDSLINTLRILRLTNDSLTLSKDADRWRYKRVE